MPKSAPNHRSRTRQAIDARRPTAAARGYDSRWRRYRTAFLAKPENAVCRDCERQGIAEPATVVDHIKPHRGNSQLFWDKSNHQPLCKRCHDRKTATHDGGFGRH